MADEREFGTQELVSAKYLANIEATIDSEVDEADCPVQPRRSGLEQTVRWLTPLVVVMLVSAAGGTYWLNRASIASKAGDLKNRHCAVDLVLWAFGSKQTFNSALSEKLKQAQRDPAYQIEMKPAFKTQFDGADFHNLSESWNGGRGR
jgi:hypothetical protein